MIIRLKYILAILALGILAGCAKVFSLLPTDKYKSLAETVPIFDNA